VTAIKAFVVYVLMLIAAVTDNKKMQAWLEGIIWAKQKGESWKSE
jgi:hypothetical protein